MLKPQIIFTFQVTQFYSQCIMGYFCCPFWKRFLGLIFGASLKK